MSFVYRSSLVYWRLCFIAAKLVDKENWNEAEVLRLTGVEMIDYFVSRSLHSRFIGELKQIDFREKGEDYYITFYGDTGFMEIRGSSISFE